MPQDKRQNAEKLTIAAHTVREFDVKERDDLGFAARVLVQVTLPHLDPGDVRGWGRSNGRLSLTIQPGVYTDEDGEVKSVGLPYGSYPRLVLAWITTEAVRTKSPRLVLGESLNGFMRELDLLPTGGKWGTITRLREQMKRLFSARIGFVYEGEDGYSLDAMQVARRVRLWWDPKRPDEAARWESEVILGDEFFDEIIDRAVPLDMRALKAIKQSALALDLYCWLTYRVSYLRHEVSISWSTLHEQFGADYSNTYEFTRYAKRQLRRIKLLWPDLKYRTPRGRLVIKPSPTHVGRVGSK